MPLVSIIVPVYNTAAYLARCMDSLLGQSLSDIEVIAVNDGSSDGSLDILRGYAAADRRVVVLDRANGGQAAARNDGLSRATGDFIGFVDSDDYIDRDMYQSLLNLAQSSGADMAICNDRIVGDRGVTPHRLVRDEVVDIERIGLENYLFRYMRAHIHSNSLCTRLYSARLLRENGLRLTVGRNRDEGEIAEDLFFNIKAAFHMRKAACTSKALYNYYQREGSSMHCVKPRLMGRIARMLEDFYAYAAQHLDGDALFALQQRMTYSVICEEASHYVRDGHFLRLARDMREVYENTAVDGFIKARYAFEPERIEKVFREAYTARMILLYAVLERLRLTKMDLDERRAANQAL